MKRLYLVTTLMLLTVVATGCQQGKWRLRGARCRPGMSMPTYAQPPVPSAPPASCNPAYPGPGYMQGSGYMPSEGMVSGGVVVQEFPTTPIDGQTQVLQRPIITSPAGNSFDDGDVIMVPGPEQGPLPNS
jgi:hypothetical protein